VFQKRTHFITKITEKILFLQSSVYWTAVNNSIDEDDDGNNNNNNNIFCP
jgi:hypothetical protein